MKTYLISINTVRETLRQKLLILITLLALALIASSKYFLRLDMGHEQLRFIFDFGSGALGFFGSVIAITAVCQLFHSEIENKTVVTLLSRPVRKADFVFGKIFGVCAALALFTLAVAVATGAMLAYTHSAFNSRGINSTLPPNYGGFCVFVVIQWLKLCAIAAIAALVCSAARSFLFSVIVSFMALAVSFMNNAAFALGETPNVFTNVASSVFPDLGIFAESEAFVFAPVDINAAAGAVAYALTYVIAAGLIASWIFSRREF